MNLRTNNFKRIESTPELGNLSNNVITVSGTPTELPTEIQNIVISSFRPTTSETLLETSLYILQFLKHTILPLLYQQATQIMT